MGSYEQYGDIIEDEDHTSLYQTLNVAKDVSCL